MSPSKYNWKKALSKICADSAMDSSARNEKLGAKDRGLEVGVVNIETFFLEEKTSSYILMCTCGFCSDILSGGHHA